MTTNGRSTESINEVLADHQSTLMLEDWDFAEVAADLHRWTLRMVLEFKLEIGAPALQIERLRRAYGHYRPGRNGFGLRDEIAIDEAHAQAGPYWQVLGTLLHELLHSWQGQHGCPGKRNYHNKVFQRKAGELGLIVDQNGRTEYAPPETPFSRLLAKHGVEAPKISQPIPVHNKHGSSKLKLYECPCGVKVRVGRSRFRALCLECNDKFERRD